MKGRQDVKKGCAVAQSAPSGYEEYVEWDAAVPKVWGFHGFPNIRGKGLGALMIPKVLRSI